MLDFYVLSLIVSSPNPWQISASASSSFWLASAVSASLLSPCCGVFSPDECAPSYTGVSAGVWLWWGVFPADPGPDSPPAQEYRGAGSGELLGDGEQEKSGCGVVLPVTSAPWIEGE